MSGGRLGGRPLAMTPEWQARFNKLLEKQGTSPAQAAQVTSSRGRGGGRGGFGGAQNGAYSEDNSVETQGFAGTPPDVVPLSNDEQLSSDESIPCYYKHPKPPR